MALDKQAQGALWLWLVIIPCLLVALVAGVYGALCGAMYLFGKFLGVL